MNLGNCVVCVLPFSPILLHNYMQNICDKKQNYNILNLQTLAMCPSFPKELFTHLGLPWYGILLIYNYYLCSCLFNRSPCSALLIYNMQLHMFFF